MYDKGWKPVKCFHKLVIFCVTHKIILNTRGMGNFFLSLIYVFFSKKASVREKVFQLRARPFQQKCFARRGSEKRYGIGLYVDIKLIFSMKYSIRNWLGRPKMIRPKRRNCFSFLWIGFSLYGGCYCMNQGQANKESGSSTNASTSSSGQERKSLPGRSYQENTGPKLPPQRPDNIHDLNHPLYKPSWYHGNVS